MLFGLAIGLSVAFAVYVKDRGPDARPAARDPASLASPLDDNGEAVPTPPAGTEAAEPAAAEPRFTFYDVLPSFEVVVPDETPDETADKGLQAVVEPGLYVLQAGSFSTATDADRRRAELALHGIESRIQRVTINDRNFYRVNIGPIDDLEQLNVLRSRLHAAKIDVLRIRVRD
jgi:cell division protein FtsN